MISPRNVMIVLLSYSASIDAFSFHVRQVHGTRCNAVKEGFEERRGFLAFGIGSLVISNTPVAYALRTPQGLNEEIGKGKYDEKMDPLYAEAIYGTGPEQIAARKAIRAKGEKVPAPRS